MRIVREVLAVHRVEINPARAIQLAVLHDQCTKTQTVGTDLGQVTIGRISESLQIRRKRQLVDVAAIDDGRNRNLGEAMAAAANEE